MRLKTSLFCILMSAPLLLFLSTSVVAKRIRSGAGSAAIASPAKRYPAQTNSSSLRSERWQGEWASPDGFVYSADLRLDFGADNSVQGLFNWTLKKSPRADEQAKIGLKGVEYVKGRYYPDCGAIIMEGYRLDDQHKILGMDKYRLILAANYSSLGGVTDHQGSWDGRIFLKSQ
jgi:hypothetical protein